MSDTPETDKATEVESMRVPLVTYEFSQKLELQRDKARKERDQWRECAEKLADAFEDVPHDPFTIGWSNAQECEKALAKFDRLKGETK